MKEFKDQIEAPPAEPAGDGQSNTGGPPDGLREEVGAPVPPEEARDRDGGASSSAVSESGEAISSDKSNSSGTSEQQRKEGEERARAATEERQGRLGLGEYEPTTDDSGRVVATEGWLKMQPGESPTTEAQEGKDRGHLIGKQFGGTGDENNVIPIDPRINRSFLNAFEGAIADEVKSGRELYLKVAVDYGPDGLASRLTYNLFERRDSEVRDAGSMVIDPNKSRDYTLKQGLGGESAREFANPFHQSDRKCDS